MTISNRQEGNILNSHFHGYPQRRIALETEVCLETVNKRIQLFKREGTIHKSARRKSFYDSIEDIVRNRIRFFLGLERRRDKYTLNQIHDALTKEGFEITKSKVKGWVRKERNTLKDGHLDMYYQLGKVVQFDWGSKKMKVAGKNRIIHFAVFALPFSNYRYVYTTERMDGKAFVDAFINFTKHVGCVFPVMMIDNMKIAVKHRSFKKREVEFTDLFNQLSEHYGMEIRPCTPYQPNQKGTVENAVRTLKSELLAINRKFHSIQSLQSQVEEVLKRVNDKQHHEKNDTCKI